MAKVEFEHRVAGWNLLLGAAVAFGSAQGCAADGSAPAASDGMDAFHEGGEVALDLPSSTDGGVDVVPTDPGDGPGAPGGVAGAASEQLPARVESPAAELVPDGQLTAGIFDDNLSFGFFSRYFEGRQSLVSGQTLPIAWEEFAAAHDAWQAGRPQADQLDVSLVIDTTGSMGDELGYLKNEFAALWNDIAQAYPNTVQRWSLVVYRDQGDAYVVRSFDFTESGAAFQADLADQDFGGGGDFPEALEVGIATSNSLGWRSGEGTARLMFLVADAPHHDKNAQAVAAAVLAAQAADIRIYPVASSGIDALTELTFRSAAQLTRGRYIFLTDDSGLGAGHKEPTLPCYYVTTLKTAIMRSVRAELDQETAPPTPSETVRFVGGLNEAGHCFYGDGFAASPF